MGCASHSTVRYHGPALHSFRNPSICNAPIRNPHIVREFPNDILEVTLAAFHGAGGKQDGTLEGAPDSTEVGKQKVTQDGIQDGTQEGTVEGTERALEGTGSHPDI